MDKDKPRFITDDSNVDVDTPVQTEEKRLLAVQVQDLFRASFEAKEQMDLMNKWATFDDYKHGIQNEPTSPEHPGSTTNIIHPIIEGQISDLTDKPFDVSAEGEEPGDHFFAEDVQHALEYILDKNEFPIKLDVSEHDRLELGTTTIKVYHDAEALNKRGLPSFEIISPPNFFPDPKWTSANHLQEGEFQIHAIAKPLSFIRRKFPRMGKYVVREVTCPYQVELGTENFKTDEVEVITSQKAMLIECYMKDANGELYCVHVANHIVLEDSREVLKGKKLQRRNQYPFVVIPCYTLRGTGWGQSDTELLIPTQDMINDMDDQIRMTARMMGNPQIAIGMNAGKGFDQRKWTNAAGLRVPLRDVNSFKLIPPMQVSPDVVNRREKGFEEANIVSGRPDVNRGEAPGQITAAAAIVALQQAGQKGVLHKAKMWKQGWKKVLELLYDEMITNWDEPMWVRINGTTPDFKFINPAELRKAPVMVPNLNQGEDEDSIKQLLGDPQPMLNAAQEPMFNDPQPLVDELGQPLLDDMGRPQLQEPTQMMLPPEPMTRDAEFDLKLNIGDGLPNDKAFVYQTLIELSKSVVEGRPVISWQELRDYLRDQVGIPLKADDSIMMPPMPGTPPMPGQLQVMQGGAQGATQGQVR